MGRELAQLSFLSRTIADPGQHAQALSQVITEAILLRSRRDDKLNTVLGPTVERIFTSSVRRNPETLANQIFPVIGPAIRRSISETFLSMLQDLNSTLEMSLSLKGLKWRLEALRARKPFSEIVLMHTLLYHVEEIYLIHAETGLVLDHMVSEGGESRDADLVAGMFTAITDFIKDSFTVERGDSLDNMRFGDRTIHLRRADQVYLACVVRGNPPASLSQDLQEALELMVVDCAEALDNFQGSVEPFKKARRFFEDFLRARYQDAPKKPPLVMRLLPLAVFVIIAAAVAFSAANRRAEAAHGALRAQEAASLASAKERSKAADQARIEAAIGRIGREPGLVVARVSPEAGGKVRAVVLRDNLARDPREILEEEPGGLDPARIEVATRPYVSLDGEIVRQRLAQVIDPLPTVKMDFDEAEGLLTLTGSAPLGWILEARERALSIPGVSKLDSSGLTDPKAMSMERLMAAINGVVIHFPTNSDEPEPEDRPRLVKAVNDIVELERLAQDMRMSVTLVIYGHADATGTDRRNYELSESRTKTVASMLYARGSSIPIVNYGLGSQFSPKDDEGPPKEDPESRKIELRVRLAQGAPLADPGFPGSGN
jgi:OOP family OmpA-OmpF porin